MVCSWRILDVRKPILQKDIDETCHSTSHRVFGLKRFRILQCKENVCISSILIQSATPHSRQKTQSIKSL